MAIRVLDTAVSIAVTTAAAVTEVHAAPREAVPAADITGAAPGGDPGPAIHHGPGLPGIAAIDHGPTRGTDPVIKAGLDLPGGTRVIDLVLQITNTPGMLRSLLTENVAEHVSIPFHKPNTDQVAKIIQYYLDHFVFVALIMFR